MQQVIIAVIIVVVLYFVLLFKRKNDNFVWVKSDPWWKPPAVSYGQDPKQFLLNANKNYGPFFKLFLGIFSPVIIQRADVYSVLFKSQESSVSVKQVGSKLLKGLALDHYSAFDDTSSFTASHESYNVTKRGFTGKQLHYVSQVILRDQLKKLIWNNNNKNNNNNINNKTQIKVNLLSSQLILTTTLRYMFGDEFLNSEKGFSVDEFANLFREFELIGVRPINLLLPFLPFGIPKVVRELKQKIKNRLDAAAKYHWQNPGNEVEYNGEKIFDCYLSLALRHVAKANDEMEKRKENWRKTGLPEVRNHVHWGLFAVHTNTAVTLAWCITHLAYNTKLRQEFLQGEVSIENLVYEANAHFAVTTTVPRTVMQDINIKTNNNNNNNNDNNNNTSNFNNSVNLPKGTTLLIDQTMTLHDYFPDILLSKNFDPKRWISEKGKKVIEQQLFLPFGIGPHVCLGRAAAIEYIKTTLTDIFSENEVSIVGGNLPGVDKAKSVGMFWPDDPTIEITRKQ